MRIYLKEQSSLEAKICATKDSFFLVETATLLGKICILPVFIFSLDLIFQRMALLFWNFFSLKVKLRCPDRNTALFDLSYASLLAPYSKFLCTAIVFTVLRKCKEAGFLLGFAKAFSFLIRN